MTPGKRAKWFADVIFLLWVVAITVLYWSVFVGPKLAEKGWIT